jgi:hypothetical protein
MTRTTIFILLLVFILSQGKDEGQIGSISARKITHQSYLGGRKDMRRDFSFSSAIIASSIAFWACSECERKGTSLNKKAKYKNAER